MGDVVEFRSNHRPPAPTLSMDFAGLMAARNPPSAEVIPSPAPVRFWRWVRCLDVDRAAWTCLRHLSKGEHEAAIRWWQRHHEEALRTGPKTMRKADIEKLWARYREAVRRRIEEIKAEHRTREEWENALSNAGRRYGPTSAPHDFGQGRDGVA